MSENQANLGNESEQPGQSTGEPPVEQTGAENTSADATVASAGAPSGAAGTGAGDEAGQRITQEVPAGDVPTQVQQPWGEHAGPVGGAYYPPTATQPGYHWQQPGAAPYGQAWATPPGEPKKPAAWRTALIAGVAALAAAGVGGGVGGYVGYSLHNTTNVAGTTASAGTGTNSAPVIDRSSLASIAAAVEPSVVVIQTQSGEGSGVVISSDGYIVTNNHVVADAQGNTVRVTFNSGKKVNGTIVGTDPKTDLAVVQVKNVTGLTVAKWGDSSSVRVGDTVLAIGSPLGLEGSVTAGIVSALHRTITVGGGPSSPFDFRGGNNNTSVTIGDALQTDAPINPGNSGGALVNTSGEVIGINSAIATSGQGSSGNIGVGFSIPSNRAKTVADEIIKGTPVSHPFLGVQVADAPNGGAQIASVESGSPAAKAGLKAGDVVVKANGETIGGSEALVAAVQGAEVGQPFPMTVQRNGSTQTITATLAEAP